MLVNPSSNSIMLSFTNQPDEFTVKNLFSIIEVCSYTTIKHNLINLKENTYNSDEVIIMYVFKGQGLISVNERTYGVKTNDICILDNKEKILISNNDWGVNYIIVKSNSFKNILLNSINGTEVFSLKNRTKFHHILDQIHNNHFSKPNTKIHLSYLLGSLLDLINNEVNVISTKQEDPITKAILECINIIENNFGTNLRVSEIADQLGFNLSYFTRKFTEKITIPPYQYLLTRRIDHAKYLLVSTSKKVSEILEICGFQNETNFYYVFKKKVAITPKEYRKAHI